MLDFILLIMIIMGFFIGMRRGFILQLIHMVGFWVSFLAAYLFFDDLAPRLRLWIPYPEPEPGSEIGLLIGGIGTEEAFYRAIAFVVIFIAARIVLGMIGSALDFVASIPVLRTLNVWAGGILGLLEIYLIILILLYVASLVPSPALQQALDGSLIAKSIIQYTPFLSGSFEKWWIDYVE